MFQGKSLRVTALQQAGLFELCFDREGDPINKFDERTLQELRQATELLRAQPGLRGVLVSSAKDAFIVGADIVEFGEQFGKPAELIAAGVARSNEIFVALEDLPVPTVAAINGFALGGGLELALTASLRVMSTAAQVGVPEVKLGIFPGFGGTVRLSRVAGPAVACEWVSSGKAVKAADALRAGVVDAISAPELLRATALDWLHRAIDGEVDWAAAQQRKRLPVMMPVTQMTSIFSMAREKAERTGLPHQPAAVMALEMMQEAAGQDRAGALALEAQAFGRVARTQAAASLVQAFLNDQALRKQLKRQLKGITPAQQIAAPLQPTQDLVGMHVDFPLPNSLLVEVVRGSGSSDDAVAKTLAYVVATGKTPVVVRDGPGFLVNRLWIAYLRAFLRLVADGASFVKVDEAMESFGWPLGPAGLVDVVGIDVVSALHDVIAAAYPERMPVLEKDVLRLMAGLGRCGQKNERGFYRYELVPDGKPKRSLAFDAVTLLAPLQAKGPREFAQNEIIDRMMLPMVIEAVHALDEGVVATAAELDTALKLGLGFPAYAGGPLQYADWLGLDEVVARCDRLGSELGPAYQPTPHMRQMAASGDRFHV